MTLTFLRVWEPLDSMTSMILPALSLWEPYAFSIQQHQTPPSFAILILIWHELGSAGSLTWSCLMLPPVINRKGPKKQTVYSTALIFSIYHLSGMHSVTILKKKNLHVQKSPTMSIVASWYYLFKNWKGILLLRQVSMELLYYLKNGAFLSPVISF